MSSFLQPQVLKHPVLRAFAKKKKKGFWSISLSTISHPLKLHFSSRSMLPLRLSHLYPPCGLNFHLTSPWLRSKSHKTTVAAAMGTATLPMENSAHQRERSESCHCWSPNIRTTDRRSGGEIEEKNDRISNRGDRGYFCPLKDLTL